MKRLHVPYQSLAGASLLTLCLLLPATTWAQVLARQGLSVHTDLRQEMMVLTRESNLQKLRSVVTFEPEYVFSSQLYIQGAVRAEYDLRYDLDDTYASRTDGAGQSRLQLREAMLVWSRNNVDWNIGKQLITWGKTDGVRLLDVINPLDLREFILEDFEDAKIPLWMIDRRQYIHTWTLQTLAVFDYESTHFAPFQTDYYDRYNHPSVLDPYPEFRPDDFSLRDAEVGSRLSGAIRGVDVSFNYFYTYDDVFSVELEHELTPGGTAVFPSKVYDRQHLYGGSFSGATRSVVWRGEVAYVQGKRFALDPAVLFPTLTASAEERGLRGRGQSLYLAGLDYATNDWFLSGQVYIDHLHGQTDLLRRKGTESILTALIQREAFHDLLRVRLFTIYAAHEGAWLWKVRTRYFYNDRFTLSLLADLFAADGKDGFFKQYRGKSRFGFSIRYQL